MTTTEQPRTSNRNDEDGATYKKLLESTRAIPWKIDWATMTFAYIGPQIEELLGWSQKSWATANDWAERIHPDERQWVVDYCIAQSKAGVDHEADYRARHKDGRWVWIRDVVHVVRNAEGVTEALIGFMFDISERKRVEEEVARLQRELEDLSFKDGLTGVANRRRLDALLESEWKLGQRERSPLSLLLIDIDLFKQYNDHYGHVRGDDCLKRVAAALAKGATRPRDIVARYGGEEFAVVLPNTDATGAETVAAACREALMAEAIPHERSTVAPMVTISIGAGTVVPSDAGSPTQLVEAVDKALYVAKQEGRNRVVVTR